jgi:hypothetical protein
VGWDRKRKGPESGYYYRSVRTPDGGVKKLYLGRGAAAEQAAAAVERRRQEWLAAREAARAERAATAEADRLAAALREWAGLLAAAWLVLTGHHRHHGEWRLKNG